MMAETYADLPNRVIVYNPFFQRSLVSYGVVAYCPATGRFLLVQRNNSPEFINYVRGSYRNSDLPRMAEGFSLDEHAIALQLVGGQMSLATAYRMVIGDQYTTEDGYQYAQLRFKESLALMERLLPIVHCKPEKEWLIPKGRLSPGETVERCAQREFYEEAGLRITPRQRLVARKPLIESFRGENGRIYETRCWVYSFPQELEPPPVTDTTGEIGARRWMTLDEAKQVLRPSKYQLLIEAKRWADAAEGSGWSDPDEESRRYSED